MEGWGNLKKKSLKLRKCAKVKKDMTLSEIMWIKKEERGGAKHVSRTALPKSKKNRTWLAREDRKRHH